METRTARFCDFYVWAIRFSFMYILLFEKKDLLFYIFLVHDVLPNMGFHTRVLFFDPVAELKGHSPIVSLVPPTYPEVVKF